ncbi:hypothetical protein J4Q44_G00304740 [Coregonus suidteri]|uniref:Uncharacterized protein n=1 Tax=Coregonus suidteri TaxID=861788 RepID=A0AAN8L113_9TELE
MPGKWAKYGRKCCKDCEKERGILEWIKSIVGDDRKSYCMYCKLEMRAHHADLISHALTEKHTRNAAPFSNGTTHVRENNTVKRPALQMAAHIACRSSIATVDHLGCVVEDIAKKGIKIHRTKYTALINAVKGPTVHEELIKDIGNESYSLIIVESTDITTKKLLCVAIRYHSKKLSNHRKNTKAGW